ncbi:MAG: response regulator transcription factor [Variovorax sp.]|nr:MAG: response regulator transcription factor [Variovorax sp.]
MSDALPTVFVVDDDPSVLKSFSRLLRSLGWQAETYGSPEEFLRQYDPAAPGCLVLDVAMPGVDGLELQRRLADAGCPLPIVFITGQGDIPTSVRAMRAGALNFLVKPVNDEDLLKAVGEAVEADTAARRAQRDMALVRERLATLTPREREVLDQVVAGKLNKQIAGDLGTVEKTIKVHRAHVMEKMGARSLAELARMGERLGIGAPDTQR